MKEAGFVLSLLSILYLTAPCSGQIIYGHTGATGPIGPPGNRGAYGPMGVSGPAGEPGPAGSPGFPGSPGAKGVPGPGGGPAGGTGSSGATGSTGPRGQPGERGADGPTGPRGPEGPAGLIIQAIPIEENAVLGLPPPPDTSCIRTLLEISLSLHVLVAIAAVLLVTWQHRRVSNLYKRI